MTVVLEQVLERVVELGDIIRDEVGEVAVFRLAPNILNRVEFGRITGKPRYVQPRAASLVQAADRRAVGGQAIADQQQRTTQLVMHAAEEPDHVVGAGVMVQEVVVHAETLGPGCAGESRYRRDAVVAVPRILHRCLSARAHTRRRSGCNKKPLSSRKTKLACRAVLFF